MKLKIGPVLTSLIDKKRLTLKEISQACGVPASTLSEWKLNRMPKNPEHLRLVAEHLDVSLHYLLFGEEDGNEPLQKLIKEDLFQGTFEITLKRVRITDPTSGGG
ncbi:MAG: helix-turn-helix domain-containing protein [Bdellovibrionales bacterium]